MANVLLLSCLILLHLAIGALSLSDRRISVPTSRISMQLQALASGQQRLIPQMSWEVVGVAVTLCSIVPGFWWLRRRSSTSAKAEGTQGRIMRHAIETTGKDRAPRTSRSFADHSRCRDNRSGTSEEALRNQVIQNKPIYLLEHPYFLQATSPSRETSLTAFTAPRIYPWTRRIGCTIQQSLD